MSEKELQAVIKTLEALKEDAFRKSDHAIPTYAANKNGQYMAYHKSIEIIKKAMKSGGTEDGK